MPAITERATMVTVRTNEAYRTRHSVVWKIRELTGVKICWREGDSFRFPVRDENIKVLVDAGLDIKVTQ